MGCQAMTEHHKLFTQNDMDIALLQKEMSGLRDQQKAHANEMRIAFKEVGDDLKELTATLNRGKGMFAGAMIVAGAFGAAITKGIAYLAR